MCNRWIGFIAWLACSTAALHASEAEDIEFFEKKIRPVLADNCFSCHSPKENKIKGKLRVDSREFLLTGGETGPAINLEQPEKSLLLEAVSYTNPELQMPPKTKLAPAVVADLKDWIKRGAVWPSSAGGAPAEVKTGAVAKDHFDLAERKAKHWAWKPITPKDPPVVQDMAWATTAIDKFILAKLEDVKLKPAPQADKRSLLRRAHIQLTGIPPTAMETEAFMKDESPNAYENLVDRLLASPRFGEHWGRHWLDLMRYAESRGHEFDFTAPNAWQYRDYVIRALNADVPYDQFLREQIAGDLLPNPRRHPEQGFNESIIGTGFWFLGEVIHSPVDIRQDEVERFDNMVDVMSKTFLGLTVSCARCHDHKFDAISARDYYRLFGFLKSSRYRLARFDTMEDEKLIAAELAKFRAEQAKPLCQAVSRDWTARLDRVDDYLLAAKDVWVAARAGAGLEVKKDPNRTKGDGVRPAGFPPETRALVAEKAKALKLDENLLGEWICQLTNSNNNPGDPLHAWARFALEKTPPDAGKITATLNAWQADQNKRNTELRDVLKTVEPIVDYASLEAGNWFSDGPSFGAGPVKPGEILFGANPNLPLVAIAERGAAIYDPTWIGLKPAARADAEPGNAGYDRASRTLSTPSFEIKHPRVFCLIRGSVHIYAAVDSHLLINGPLHGNLVNHVTSKNPDEWRWHALNLTDYVGQRAHLDFTPAGADFEVAFVGQGPNVPSQVPGLSSAALQELSKASSIPLLAKSYKTMFLQSAAWLENAPASNPADTEKFAGLANWLAGHPELLGPGTTPEVKTILDAQAKITSKIKTESRLAMAMMDLSGEDDYVMIRGGWRKRGVTAARGMLEAIAGSNQPPITQGSGRLELANRMLAADDPFVPRVMVNRIWHHLFGRGIVPSTDNFGELGERPTHPELLDYLATQFVKNGWSIKKSIREMMLSSTFKMSTRKPSGDSTVDPNNQLLSHMRIRRLESESLRDSLLTVSGRLNPDMYGPSTLINLTDFMQGRGHPGSGPLDGDGRRSIYLSVRRNFLSPMMLAFDTPIPFSTMGRRSQSNVPAQALILMNDPFVMQQAEIWSKRVTAKTSDFEQRVSQLYVDAFARQPSKAEIASAREFMDGQGKELGSKDSLNDPKVWADFAHVLFNTKEFLYVD